ncbi:transglycosylase SLT domain-containing protein [Methylobacterium nigriterrae]|uniref:transglycosylase SLT domain-containing protein n=1 Tax=Methylobacterium nigriterrae TaxID=3127512 RepID=UPI003013EEE6
MRGLPLAQRPSSDLASPLLKLLLTYPALLSLLLLAAPVSAAPSQGATETVEQALCRLIDGSAKAQGLPVPFLTRLIWRESSFRVSVVSPVGAQGVAQFMPGTAQERGLLDPFDPEQAIPHAARLLRDLKRRFGNLGLAAAAYNGGPARVTNWIAGSGGLPAETRAYVLAVTGRSVEDWREGEASSEAKLPEAKPVGKSTVIQAQDAKPGGQTTKTEGSRGEDATRKSGRTEKPRVDQQVRSQQTCLQVTAALRIPSRGDRFAASPNKGASPSEKPVAPPWGPWGIQLAANFSKFLALQSFSRAQASYAKVIGGARPMIIGTRLRTRGTQAFYRIRIPAQSRQAADELCGRIRTGGGACIVLRT